MPRGYRWSEDLADDYIESGLPIDTVAAKYGLGAEALRHLARKNGWPRAGKHARHLAEVSVIYRAGVVTNSDLAKAYGIPLISLQGLARKGGWQRVVRNKGGRPHGFRPSEHRVVERCRSMMEHRLRVAMLTALEVRV